MCTVNMVFINISPRTDYGLLSLNVTATTPINTTSLLHSGEYRLTLQEVARDVADTGETDR